MSSQTLAPRGWQNSVSTLPDACEGLGGVHSTTVSPAEGLELGGEQDLQPPPLAAGSAWLSPKGWVALP